MTPVDKNRRYADLMDLGCIACHMMGFGRANGTEQHHLNTGGVAGQLRRGDEFSIPLCRWHHRGEPVYPISCPSVLVTEEVLGPSLKLTAKLFRETFGDDDTLLALTNRLTGARNETNAGA